MIAVDMRSLHERLKKSVNLTQRPNDTDFPNCDLQTLAFEQLHKKLLEERQLNPNEAFHQTYRQYITANILFLMKNKDKKYYTKLGAEIGKIYSKRYYYSMIAFYQFCLKNPRMKYAGIGFWQYKDRMMVMTQFFENDSDF